MLLRRPFGRAAAILIVCLFGTNVSFVAAQPHTPGTAQLGGWVYIDRNNDGDLAFMNEPNPEYVIGNVTISLYSQTGPETLVATTTTDQFGRYFFNDLSPGTYGLKQTQPIEYVDGTDTLGKMIALTNAGVPGSASVGVMSNNAFNNVVLPADVRGDFFNFGELGLAPGFISKRFLLGSAPELPTGMIPEPATATMVIVALLTGLVPRRRRRD
jgi:SdrD B-like domain